MTPSIYKGKVMHDRLTPKRHQFNHTFYFYSFDPDSLEQLDKHVTGFGHNRFRPVSICDKDYINSSAGSILDKLKQWLGDHGLKNEFQTVKLVTSPRYFNYVFNPVSFYLCYGQRNDLQTVVAEVNNTFHERHIYVVDQLTPTESGWVSSQNTAKCFHVSPFNAMDGEYKFTVFDSDAELRIHIDIIKNGTAVFCTELYGKPTPLDGRSLWKCICMYPIRPLLTFPRILWEASILYFRKKLTVYNKPTPNSIMTTSTRKPTLIQKMAMILVLKYFSGIGSGQLQLILPNGEKKLFGEEGTHQDMSKAIGVIHVRDYRFFTRILFRGSIGLGESYVKKFWQSDDPAAALSPMALSLKELESTDGPLSLINRMLDAINHRTRSNNKRNSRKNIQDHYDLGNDFYRTFLDPTMTYSAGIFKETENSLEEAQINKLDEIIRKADIQTSHHILEIGSGWGSLAIRAAQTTGCRVTTITLSEEQHRLASERIREAGLEDRIDVLICDYRDIRGTYDRIVSIEMLEAVGHEYLADYFIVCKRLLKPDGQLVLQVITIPDERYENYCRSCDWIQKYVFPGGHLPSVGAIKKVTADTSTFNIQEMENIGLHYARTLREWRNLFMKNLPSVREQGYSESFIRKWEYYLSYCEAGFGAEIIDTQHIVLKPLAGK